MRDFGNYVLDVLGEFGGGRGDGSDDLPRFGLGIIFWAVLLVAAVLRRRRRPAARESLLIVGFAVGLGRELFMFTVKSLQLYGVVSTATLEKFFPPLEHSLMVGARTVIAAAFLRYLLNDRRIAQRFMIVGLAATAAFYAAAAPIWLDEVRQDPAIRFSKFWGDWVVHSLGLVLSLVAIALLLRAGSWVRTVVVAAFTLFLLDDAMMLVNLATDEEWKTVFTPLRHNAHLWAIPTIGFIYLRELRHEREHLELQLRQAERLEAVGQLAAGVAHDFNNLLQVIVGYTDAAQDRVGPDHPVTPALDQVAMAVDRAAILVRQLLTFSRQEEAAPVNVNLNDVVTEVTPMLTRLLGAEIRIEHELASSLPSVWADANMIEQIIVNLAINARDAMPEGGTIRFETDAVTELDLGDDASAATSRTRVRLSVSDTGVGMDRATLERVFEPFFTTKPVGEGTGLGLATVYGAVQRHGGQVRITSDPGAGTTVIIDLPASATQSAAEPAGSAPIPTTGTETILVAEDESEIRNLVVDLLGSAGYRVIVATDGVEAVREAAAYRARIDLFLFDVAMPNLNGYRAFEAISPGRPDIPVLFMTGSTTRTATRRNDLPHLLKPFGRTRLLVRVREVLDAQLAEVGPAPSEV